MLLRRRLQIAQGRSLETLASQLAQHRDDALGIGVGVEFAGDGEAGRRGRGGDQLDYGQATGQRAAAPVLRDVAEE